MPTRARSGQGLLERTRHRIVTAWRDALGAARGRFAGGALRPDLPDDDLERLRQRIDECLVGRGGEVSARSRAVRLGEAYDRFDDVGRARFLRLLATDYAIDKGALEAAIAAVAAADESARPAAVPRLRDVLVSPRIKFLRQFSGLKEGVKFLIDLRADLRALAQDDPSFREFDEELRTLLASWFDVGFLELKRITWQTPAALLEKLIEYEAVHEIRSWEDLKNRLDSDRRCYAFFHPRMPGEPLIFVEIALVTGLAGNIQDLLDARATKADLHLADTAIFYSISSAQKGLAGVSFGNFLIKQVIDDLGHEFPNVHTFATLSPIPGFRRWIERAAARGEPLLDPAEAHALADLAGVMDGAVALVGLMGDLHWHENAATAAALKPILLRLCARYLLVERSDARALDPVAHFHLSNGARIGRLNWLGDRSAKGLDQSAGLMVNYLYDLREIEDNHEAYTGEARVIASSAVKTLL